MSLYVDELFDEIVALPPGEREQALARRCAEHPSVEAEVRALLHMADEEPGPPPALEPGASLGRYRLEERLGAGATASVWKAFDTHLETFTALKLLHPDLRVGDALDAVMHEARAASGILSDHVVRIKTAGRLYGGPHFIEMELCAEHRPDTDGAEVLEVGRTLADVTLRDLDEVVRVVAEAARGVDAAHRVGVLHRDLKPSNILLTPVSRRALVTDFGLAAPQLYPAPAPSTPATQTITFFVEAGGEKLAGTPAYMPPEQAWGHPITRAGDVYALGATLYALLAGRPPYEPDGRHPVQAMDVIQQVRLLPPPPLAEVSTGVPRRLQRIVEKAMARDASERYPTAAALADDLELYRADRRTSVDPRSPALSASLFAHRNREAVTSALLLMLLLLASVGAVGWLQAKKGQLEVGVAQAEMRRTAAQLLADQAERTRELAEAERARAEAERDRALAEAELAREAREAALRSESDAEARAAAERLAREAAQRAEEASALELEAAAKLLDEARAATDVASRMAAREAERREELADRLEEASERVREAERRVETLTAERDRLARERDAAVAERQELRRALELVQSALAEAVSPPADPVSAPADDAPAEATVDVLPAEP